MQVKSHIGPNIKRARKAAKLTQEQLGRKVGVGLQTVARWEQGRLTPRLANVYAVAAALKVSAGDLLTKKQAGH